MSLSRSRLFLACVLLSACASPSPAAPGRRAEPPPAPPVVPPAAAPPGAATARNADPTPSPTDSPHAPSPPPSDHPTTPTDDSRFTVSADGTLTFESPGKTRVVDHRVLNEIAISPDRTTVAYPRRSAASGTEIISNSVIGEFERPLSPGLRDARMPAFAVDPPRAIFWARDPTHAALGLYVVDLRVQPAQPRRVTNLDVRNDRDPRFVPPPRDFTSLRVDRSGRVTYTGPAGPVTATLPQPSATP